MNKHFVYTIICLYICIFYGCSSSPNSSQQNHNSTYANIAQEKPIGNPDIYLEKTIKDIINGNLSISEAVFLDSDRYLVYKIVSDVYLKDVSDRNKWQIIISDDQMNQLPSKGSVDFILLYRLNENSDFNPYQLYRVKFILRIDSRSSYRGGMGQPVELESIEGLLTYDETLRVAQEERQRLAQETTTQKQAEAEAAYREAVASRNVDTIIRLLRSGVLDSLTSDRRTELRNEGLQEVAKIITRNNTIKIGTFDDSFVNSTVNPINPYAFDETKVYHLTIVQPQQFIEGKIIALAVPGFPNATILLQNISNIQNIRNSLREVFMRYTGITTLRMANGSNRELATFNVLYYYQN